MTCKTCGKLLNVDGDQSTQDCGGDCVRCMAEAGDPDCKLTMFLIENGYKNLRTLEDGTIVGTLDLLYTRSLVVDLTQEGWGKRYCYENRGKAVSACKAMLSGDDEPLAGYVASRGRV